ncbi:hypothetical protein C2S51_002202 [Perilla frutescens var. frutescens]|nr:hypothetical protein C2S51_002202 [Perilla frutescens var. frutescens]
MTTKLEHSINPLTRAPHNNFAVNTLIIHHCGLLRILNSPSMDRILESQKIESMRKMMLMQEQVFKQQVEELHRLYNHQKKVMQEIENELKLGIKETAAMRERSNSEFAIRPETATEAKQSFQPFRARNDPKELRSGSNSAENERMPIKFDLETTPSSSSIHPFEEQNHEMKKVDEEADVEVELTLSIGHCARKQRSKSHLQNNNCSKELKDLDHQSNIEAQELGSSSNKMDKGEAYAHQTSIISSSSVYQENTRPHWLLQDLSLNRT